MSTVCMVSTVCKVSTVCTVCTVIHGVHGEHGEHGVHGEHGFHGDTEEADPENNIRFPVKPKHCCLTQHSSQAYFQQCFWRTCIDNTDVTSQTGSVFLHCMCAVVDCFHWRDLLRFAPFLNVPLTSLCQGNDWSKPNGAATSLHGPERIHFKFIASATQRKMLTLFFFLSMYFSSTAITSKKHQRNFTSFPQCLSATS